MQQKSKIKNRQGAREGSIRWVLLPGIHGYQIHHVPTSGQGDRAFFLFYRSKRKRNKFHPSLPGHLLSKRGGGRRATQPLWGLPGAQLSYFWSWWGVRRVPWAWGLEPKKDWFKFTLFLLSRRGQAFLVIKIGLLFPIRGGGGTFLAQPSYFWSWWGVRRVPWAWGLKPKKDWFKFTLSLLSGRGQAFLVIKIGLVCTVGVLRG